jgi:hypothetical protein
MVLAAVYIVLGGAWGFMCFRHRDDLLPLQVYLRLGSFFPLRLIGLDVVLYIIPGRVLGNRDDCHLGYVHALVIDSIKRLRGK